MSQKKKLAQAARREARKVFSGYTEKLSERLHFFDEALKPRPKWIPRSVWRWCMNRFVDVDKMELALNPPKPTKKDVEVDQVK